MKNKETLKKFYSLLIILIFLINNLFNGVSVQAIEKEMINNTNLIVLFNNNNVDSNVTDFISNSGGKVNKILSDIGGIEVSCNAQLISKIKAYTTVESIAVNHNIKIQEEKMLDIKDYKNKKMNLNSIDSSGDEDLYNRYQWDIKQVTGNGKSFDVCSGNHNIVIGIIDSGIKSDHPDLEKNFMGGENFVPNEFNNDETEKGDPEDIADRYGHGTYVAGNIAANGKIKGVAPNIGFKSYRVFDSKGNTNSSIVSSAIIQATNDGVKVINLSIGGYDLKGKCYWIDQTTGSKYKLGNDMAEYELYKRAIKYAIKHNVVVVTSAGNDGIDCGNKKKLTQYFNEKNSSDGFICEGLTYEVPGTVKGVINVSATGSDNELAEYSNYGSKIIDVAAPGGDSINPCISTGISKSGYVFGEGTSIAAPKVSAIAGLILCEDPNIKPKEVAKRIYKTCDKITEVDSEKYYGAGIVNAYKALEKK